MQSYGRGPVGPSNPPSSPLGANGPAGPLPPRRDPVYVLEDVPARPGAKVVLSFDHESGFVYGVVHQGGPRSGPDSVLENATAVFYHDGESVKVDERAGWVPAGTESLTPAEDVALRVLCASGDYCRSQARTDFRSVRRHPAWQGLCDEARDMLHVCRVMMR